ncbi:MULTISPECIES: 50S ribosomal protein L17 [Pseudothermotoga]|uniref:50S ribosomal protein L17 n=2 Tax=Pseudothermotoga TaxID=1643951 RepID=A8F4U0_PSELT|nr:MULTISPECIES: 50S ribosomal protein L17 [Pseudothermotoga]ABV33174.1 ribosomal protein L17 [Pseudothermotoga lettingae TMO]MDK2884179.1 large subunit ribosomal protein [Pseudothermotoga sp.]GLI49909.1 50S ribosomal protein L17 [Pseudothermotoga lettingae TMO]HBJ81704.1 50S ribosomal protein L17 [Pseudothermotoga sp.]
MRHRMLRNKIGSYGSHSRMLLRNQMRELVEHKSIVTTVTKAKVVQRMFDKLMTKAVKAAKTSNKSESVALRRQINYYLLSRRLTNKLVDEIAKSTKKTSGFTRIVKMGMRRGDAAEMALLQIIESD